LVVGIVAFVALVAYVSVAFATTHASVAGASKVAPWTPYHAKLIPFRRGKKGPYDVRIVPTKAGSYGGLVPTLVADPAPGRRFEVGLWLKGSRGGQVAVNVDEFSPAATSVYVVDTTVQVTPKWHHFTFSFRVKGTWLGLGMNVQRQSSRAARTWFAVRAPTAGFSRG
jgi:hypothetical protein